jgi:hypothetical protein
VWLTFGCHPNLSRSFDADAEADLVAAMRCEKAVAVGEIGLDAVCDAPRAVQEKVVEFLFSLKTGTDVRIFRMFSPKKLAKKPGVFTQHKAKLFNNLIITLVFEINANFFRKLSKIAEYCDRNIDPWN